MRLQRDLPERLLQVILADLPPKDDTIDHLAPVSLPGSSAATVAIKGMPRRGTVSPGATPAKL